MCILTGKELDFICKMRVLFYNLALVTSDASKWLYRGVW